MSIAEITGCGRRLARAGELQWKRRYRDPHFDARPVRTATLDALKVAYFEAA